ncbi:MAG: hypothetical protein HY043_19075 [Verrucomicrobia bacterium]|nr:hypothetical protein [Verrucomicrobiota bacterium]
MQKLLALLVTELERPRELSAQVIKHLGSAHAQDRETIGAFLVAELPRLEDYEIDLILSPLFTPTLREQAVFAELLGASASPASQWPELIQQLVARPTVARLVGESGEIYATPLREVTIARFVNRLRLDGEIPEPLFKLIAHLPPASDRPMLKALTRRAIWEHAPRREILSRYLMASTNAEDFRLDDALELLRLMETYAPADLNDFRSRVPHWQCVLRHEVREASNPKPFFNERVQELHGGGRDQRRQDEGKITVKERELEVLDRLTRLLGD